MILGDSFVVEQKKLGRKSSEEKLHCVIFPLKSVILRFVLNSHWSRFTNDEFFSNYTSVSIISSWAKHYLSYYNFFCPWDINRKNLA